MREFEHILRMIEEINRHHGHHLQSLDESDKVLIKIKTDDGKVFPVKITKNGLEPLKDGILVEFKNIVEISLKDLLKLANHKSYIVRYIMAGRIKVKGDIKKILNILQNI